MAEIEPGAPNTPEAAQVETPAVRDLRLKVEFMQQELAQAQKELAREMAFGKYDATVPAEGEHTYSSYSEHRPTEEAAKQAADANLSGIDYYDHKAENGETVSFGAEMFEDMGVMDLAKQAALARTEGNGAREGVIREALEHHLTMDAMADDSESAEQAQERYDKDLARFDELVARFESRGNPQPPHATEAHTKPRGEGGPSARTVDSKPSETESEDSAPSKADAVESGNAFVVPDMGVESDSVDPKDKEEKTEADDPDRTFGGYFKGTRVSVADSTPHPTDPSKDMLTVVGEDSRIRRIRAADFTHASVATKADTAPDTAQLPADKIPGDGFAIPDMGVEGDNKRPGKELIPGNPASREDVSPQAEAEADTPEKQTRLEKMKARLKAMLPNFQSKSGDTHWRERWDNVKAGFGPKDRVLDHEVTDEMSEDEKERKRKRTRVVVIAGLAAATGLGLFLGLGQDKDAGENLFESTPSVSAQPSPEASESPKEKEPTIPANDGTRWTEADLNGEVELSDPIPLGGGGEELFEGLGMDISKWYNNENTILERFPDEFYRMDDGHVGIANPGPLSEEAQDFIKSL